ncbi:MAG: PqqD family protein [Oscillospiraceae bacterium]|nr:PqqD family protein [Oscillospiraceae bacterium]
MKLKEEFIVHSAGREALLVPAGSAAFAGIVKGNATLGELLSLLERDTTEAELLAAMEARYDAPAEVLARDVKKALEALRSVGALDE